MRYLCTYFDSNYLVRALPLVESLARWADDEFVLYALCLDDDCEAILRKLALPSVVVVPLARLEASDEALLPAKGNRSRIEYYFTITPCFMDFLLKQNPDMDRLVYVDADMYFFGSLSAVYREWGDSSVYVTPHRFPERLSSNAEYGRFNVGIIGVRNNVTGRACVSWWRERCLEWCYDRLEANRFADQKYLDQWPALFPGLCVSNHPGINAAPWNIEQYSISVKGRKVHVEGFPLVIYHFQGYRRISEHMIDPGINVYDKFLEDDVAIRILRPYTVEVVKAERALRRLASGRQYASGNSRIAEDVQSLSIPYQFRLFMEGRIVFNIGRFVFYCRQTGWVKVVRRLIIWIRH